MARIAMVTGAASGIGEAIARRLATDGCHVVVSDLDAVGAERVASAIGGRDSSAEGVGLDVTDAAAVNTAVDGVVARHGQLDVLVNNAGILAHRQDVVDRVGAAMMAEMAGEVPEPTSILSTLSDELWDRTIKVHLYGTFHGLRAALRHMEPARRGWIVNLASIYGLNPSPLTPEYAAAKHAIVGLTESTGREVAGLGIHVNAVAPGYIDTPLLSAYDDVMRSLITSRIPAKSMGRPEDVAALVSWLASDEARYSYGEVHEVTGGARG